MLQDLQIVTAVGIVLRDFQSHAQDLVVKSWKQTALLVVMFIGYPVRQ